MAWPIWIHDAYDVDTFLPSMSPSFLSSSCFLGFFNFFHVHGSFWISIGLLLYISPISLIASLVVLVSTSLSLIAIAWHNGISS